MNTLTEDDIIALWNKAGYTDIKSYAEISHDKEKRESLTWLHDALNPDNINPKNFWKATDRQFSTDTVCNVATAQQGYRRDTALDIKNANLRNHSLANSLGILGHVDLSIENLHRRGQPVCIAEIGCGLGSFHDNYIKDNPYDYTGFDLIPRTEYAVEIQGEDGTFSAEQLETYDKKFNVFYSCNVFQHLSKSQIEKYIKQIAGIIQLGGYFCIANAISSDGSGNPNPPQWNKSYHYGQVIELFQMEEFISVLLRYNFRIFSINQFRFSNTLNPYCILAQKI